MMMIYDTEAVARMCSVKKVFLVGCKISQTHRKTPCQSLTLNKVPRFKISLNLQGNTYARV